MKRLLLVTLTISLIWCGGCAQTTVTEVSPPPPQIPANIAEKPSPPVSPPAATPVYANITKGPFLERVYQDRAALMWESDSNEAEQLFYGSDIFLTNSIAPAPEKIEYEVHPSPDSTIRKTVFLYKTWLEKLKPGQVYNYRIAGRGLEGKTYKFRTTPDDANEATFVVYGDSRTNTEAHRKLIELIIKNHPDFVVNTGDIVTNGDNYGEYGPEFFEPLKGLAESVPVYVVKGNHDGKNGIFEKLLVPSGEKNNFGITYGPVYYYLADNCPADLRAEELLNLITANIHDAKAEWKFVTFHIPALNFGGHASDWGYPNALPMFAKAGADFVISGHSHIYERFKPVAPPIHSGASFVTYITTGGGGAPLYDIKPTIYQACTKSVFHFCLFKIKGDSLTMDTIDIEGNIIDHLEISKNKGELNEAYRQTSVAMPEMLAQQRANKKPRAQQKP